MSPRRMLVAVVGALVLGSVAAAVVWQAGTETSAPAHASASDAAPSSRSIFPKSPTAEACRTGPATTSPTTSSS
jgi:hypothetical protein